MTQESMAQRAQRQARNRRKAARKQPRKVAKINTEPTVKMLRDRARVWQLSRDLATKQVEEREARRKAHAEVEHD